MSMKVYQRRIKVRKLLLQGMSDDDIALRLGVTKSVVKSDVRAINKWYKKAVIENPHILEKQAEYILRHLDQLNLVKQKLWELEKTSVSEKTKIAALKTIVDELSHEARILKLVDTSKTVINQYVHVDKLNVLMTKIVGVIRDFVPSEQQKYAFERLKKLGDILEGEVKSDK